jgi:phage virion morphogenesis protein
MSAAVTVDKSEVLIGLGEFRAAVTDKTALLKICGEIMRTSIARTFREEGSPAGSWPQLAESTRKRKGYTAGHKLLILSGRLFGSISYVAGSDSLTIGTDVPYAAVHQFGSRDYMGGSAGPRSRSQMIDLGPYEARRVREFRRYAKAKRTGKDGRERTVRVREQGPSNATTFGVKAHTRRQNIPPRPFLVFRPDDPGNMVIGIDSYLRGKAVKIGKVGA